MVSDEPEAQVGRLRYHLAHGVKECLVEKVMEWPGVHFAKAILGGKSLKGFWFNRSQEYAARNRGEDFGRLKYAEEEELVLSQLPCWADLSPEQYREQVAGLVEEIEAEARADREARGIEPMGVEAILRQDPHTRPNHTKKSPAPFVHAAARLRGRRSGRRTPPFWLRSGRLPRNSRRETGRPGSPWARFHLPCRS